MKRSAIIISIIFGALLFSACPMDFTAYKSLEYCAPSGPGEGAAMPWPTYEDEYFEYRVNGYHQSFEVITCLIIPVSGAPSSGDLAISFQLAPVSADYSIVTQVPDNCVAVQDGKEHILEIKRFDIGGPYEKWVCFSCMIKNIRPSECFALLFKKGLLVTDTKTGETKELPIPPLEAKFVARTRLEPFSF